MTPQIKPPPKPPKTFIPEAPTPPKRFFLWWLFKYPLLVISVVLHGVLLATPIPLTKKVEQPKIENIPVTKTVSLKRTKVKPKPKLKPKPKPKLKPRLQQALTKPRPQPILQPPPKPPEAAKPKPEPKGEPDPKDKEPGSNASNSDTQKDSDNHSDKTDPNMPPPPPIENEEVETIFDQLDQALINAEVESNFEYIPTPGDFPEPEKFFAAKSIQDFDISKNSNLEANGGIINNPRYYRLKDPEGVLEILPTIPSFQSASAPKPIGEYGGGPVYEIKIEDKTYFINLVKAKVIGKATFVIFWRWDPNNPPKPDPATS
ncbi:hypothetical protein [Acaryochloris sp. IP29b_bin.137]|uniref:hypothetical protein n=1 Tax=Acaryochloris sp. IP29b_bin.137 TaxID=2969217 RepID=UPI0026379CF0|nr:hypothetical protein [Acaryochloris sp. IP29b_bin.137]